MDGVILYQVSSLQVVEGGPVNTYGNIVREKDERKTRIAQYWTKRSDSFLEQRRAELHSALISDIIHFQRIVGAVIMREMFRKSAVRTWMV